MRFRCEQCSTEYLLADEAVARASRARCPRCKHSQQLHPGGDPLTTPTGGKSEIGRVALTTRTVEPEPDPETEEELFGELDWEADSQLDFVVGQGHVQFDALPPAPPAPAPAPPPAATAPPASLRAPSSAPIDFSDIDIEDAADSSGELRGGPEADEWPENERSDPWKRTPLPSLARPSGQGGTPAPQGPPAPAGPAQSRTPPRAAAPVLPPATPRPVPGSGASPTPVPSTAATPGEPCGACGGKLVDANDLASGVCGACRARTAAALGRGVPASASGGSREPALSRGIEPDTVDLASPLVTPPSRPRYALRTMPAPDRRGPLWVLLAVLVAAAVVSGVLWYLRVRPDPADLKAVTDALPRPGKKRPPAEVRLPDGLEARLATWKPPAEPRPVADLVASAQADLAKDTEASDVAAEATLQTALVQEPRNADALGLWMEAIARGRGNQLPASELDALVRLGESALERFGRQPSLQVGLANLLLARGTPQDIVRTRILGQSAVDASLPPPPTVPGSRSPAEAIGAPSPIWGTRARLVLAEAFTAASAGLALSLLQEVQDRDPTQRRVFNVRAAAHEAAGSPRAASADLQARLAVDPDEPRTARAPGAALRARWGDGAALTRWVAPASEIPRYRLKPCASDAPVARQRNRIPSFSPDAVKLVTHALQHGRLTGTERLRAQLCLARVARAAGDLSTASQAVAAALALSPDDVQVHLQSVLVELDRSAPDQAAAHLSAVVDRLGDPALAALLEGKVRAAQQRWQAAAEAFDRAAAADARRTDARLWAGAAWAMTGSREQSMQSVAPALQADPFRDGPGVPPLWPGDGLKGAAERLVLLSKDDRDGQPLLAEAVLRVHQGDAPGAEALVDRILKTGATQAVVLGWKSILLGARGDSAAALARAQEAVASGGRTSGFAQYALGSALVATGDAEGAQRALREAQTLSPGLLAAQVRLAELEARSGAIVSARERLQRVIVLDPEYASAWRALYLLPPEG
jgi:tetratricopeptide (TPR) repeat protein